MTIPKRISVSARVSRPKTGREGRRPQRPKPADRIVRWIGVGKRRPSEQVDDVEIEAHTPRIVRLSWTDTFGRPSRVVIPALGRNTTTDARVLQFTRPAEIDGRPLTLGPTMGQPSVPVLR